MGGFSTFKSDPIPSMANSSAAFSTFATVEQKDPKQKTLVGGFTTFKSDPIPSMANSSAAFSTFATVQP